MTEKKCIFCDKPVSQWTKNGKKVSCLQWRERFRTWWGEKKRQQFSTYDHCGYKEPYLKNNVNKKE